MDIKAIKDAVEAQAKRCEIAIILCDIKVERLIPTELEDMLEYAQQMTEEFCVVK